MTLLEAGNRLADAWTNYREAITKYLRADDSEYQWIVVREKETRMCKAWAAWREAAQQTEDDGK